MNAVPEWVHMADVPPPADPEPDYGRMSRATSGRVLAALVVIGALLVLAALLWRMIR